LANDLEVEEYGGAKSSSTVEIQTKAKTEQIVQGMIPVVKFIERLEFSILSFHSRLNIKKAPHFSASFISYQSHVFRMFEANNRVYLTRTDGNHDRNGGSAVGLSILGQPPSKERMNGLRRVDKALRSHQTFQVSLELPCRRIIAAPNVQHAMRLFLAMPYQP